MGEWHGHPLTPGRGSLGLTAEAGSRDFWAHTRMMPVAGTAANAAPTTHL